MLHRTVTRLLPRLALGLTLAASTLLGIGGATAAPGDRETTDALIWLGLSERVARRHLDREDRRAIVRAERRLGLYPDGFLEPDERRVLLQAARQVRDREGYRVVGDPATGTRIGVPSAWTTEPKRIPGGKIWSSPDGAIDVSTFARKGTLEQIERWRRDDPGTVVTYATGGADWLVLSGYRNGRPFYLRASERDGEVRGFRVNYDESLSDRFDRVIVAMSGDFVPFASEAKVVTGTAGEVAANRPRDDRRRGSDRERGRVRGFELEFGTGRGPTLRVERVPELPRYAVLPNLGPEPRSRPRRSWRADRIERRPLDAPREVARRDRSGRTFDDSPIPPLQGPRRPTRGVDDYIGPRQRSGPYAVEAPVPREITGMLTDEGQSCPTLRAADGTLYALVGEVPSVRPGSMITIEAVEARGDRCSAGRPVAVGAFRVRTVR